LKGDENVWRYFADRQTNKGDDITSTFGKTNVHFTLQLHVTVFETMNVDVEWKDCCS